MFSGQRITRRRLAVTLCALMLAPMLFAAGCRTASVGSSDTSTAPTVQTTIPSEEVIPAGTALRVSLNRALNTEETVKGDSFTATLIDPLMSADGEVVVPAGATVAGEVTGVVPSERVGEQAAIRLAFQEIRFNGQTYPLAADVVETDVETSRDKSDIATGAAIGGVSGAVLGAVIGDDVGDAVLGGLLGAGAGTVISLGVGTTNAELPAGAGMTLRTTQPVDIE
jgi:hypothetical protein